VLPADALAGVTLPAAPVVAELASVPPARAGLSVLSYTRLARDPDDTRVGHDAVDVPLAIDPIEFDIDDVAGEVGPDELPPGADSGLLVHDVLEVVELDRVRDAPSFAAWSAEPDVAAQLAAAARARGIDDHFLPHAARVVHGALAAPLELVDGTTLPPLASAPALAREVEFAYPLPDKRGLVRGFIDALVAWRDDELWVVDYKTDVLPTANLSAAARDQVRAHYSVQARLYGLAADRVRGSRRLAGVLYAFVRHGIAVPVPIVDDTIAKWTVWLGDLALRRETRA